MTLEIDAITNLSKSAKLTRERELELARRWRDHRDVSARDLLLRALLPTVVVVARRYRRHSATLDELVAEGNFGLLHAISKFDPERGTRLVTYAVYWIRAYVLGYAVRSRCLVNTGVQSKLLGKLRRERDRIAGAAWDVETTEAHLVKTLGISTDKLRRLAERLDIREQTLSTTPEEAHAEDWLALAEVNAEERLLSREAMGQAKSLIGVALTGLDPRERYIVDRRLMADDEEQLTLAQVGRNLGISRERARQLEERAKRKLSKKLAAAPYALEASTLHTAA